MWDGFEKLEQQNSHPSSVVSEKNEVKASETTWFARR
jgi:hypothetical protein